MKFAKIEMIRTVERSHVDIPKGLASGPRGADMKFVTKAVSGTALALLLAAGSAYAGTDNNVYLSQTGSTNTADIHQDKGPGGNRIGIDTANPAQQIGNKNILEYTQYGIYNAATGNNVIDSFLQHGDRNYFLSNDFSGSSDNQINNVKQIGDDNSLTIGRNANTSGQVAKALEIGDTNYMGISQSAGTGNTIQLAKIDGSNNGWSRVPNGNPGGGYLGMSLTQNGTGNLITRATIIGSNNNVHGSNTPVVVSQIGDYNKASAEMKGSNVNHLFVFQTGDHNRGFVDQGTDSTSTSNSVELIQTGSHNYATATQRGDANFIYASFEGSGNGVGAMSGDAGTLVGTGGGGHLVAGQIYQDSSGTAGNNNVSYIVNGSHNLFAFEQIGGSNSITGTVGGVTSANHNEVAVAQNGDNNGASFSQMGSYNNIAINQ